MCGLRINLRHNANHTASDAGACIAGRGAQLVAANAQVVHIGVHDQSAAHNVVGAGQLDLLVGDGNLGHTVRTGFNITKVASMAHSGRWTAVRLTRGIEVRSRRNASVCVVAKLVHVETVQTSLETGDLAGNRHRCRGSLV